MQKMEGLQAAEPAVSRARICSCLNTHLSFAGNDNSEPISFCICVRLAIISTFISSWDGHDNCAFFLQHDTNIRRSRRSMFAQTHENGKFITERKNKWAMFLPRCTN